MGAVRVRPHKNLPFQRAPAWLCQPTQYLQTAFQKLLQGLGQAQGSNPALQHCLYKAGLKQCYFYPNKNHLKRTAKHEGLQTPLLPQHLVYPKEQTPICQGKTPITGATCAGNTRAAELPWLEQAGTNSPYPGILFSASRPFAFLLHSSSQQRCNLGGKEGSTEHHVGNTHSH